MWCIDYQNNLLINQTKRSTNHSQLDLWLGARYLPGSCLWRTLAAPDWWCHRRVGEGRRPTHQWSHLWEGKVQHLLSPTLIIASKMYSEEEEGGVFTTKDALLLQHRLTRVELDDEGGSAGENQQLDPKQIKWESEHTQQGEKYLLRGEDDLVSSKLPCCLVCIGHIWNKRTFLLLYAFYCLYIKCY